MDRGMNRRQPPRSGPIVLLLAAALVLGNPGAAPAGHKKGQVVTITGQVTDAEGRPLPNVSVVLEVSRRSFKLLRFWKPRQKTDTLKIPTAADQDGNYRFDWRWDPYYDTFELAVALPVKKGGKEAFEVFHRHDVTAGVRQANPVDVALRVEDSGYLDWLRRFLSGEASDDEKRIFRDLGRPDRVDVEERSAGTEVSWWYFEAGKVYRFLGGRLDQVVHFEPVPPIE